MSRYLNSPREADWYACPTCGDEVKVGSAGCRKCVALPPVPDEVWPDGVDLPEDAGDFDHAAWEEREFGTASSKIKPQHLPWKYWAAGVLVLLALVWAMVFAGFVHG